MGLQDKVNAKPGQLSGGQQQRLAIARSLAMDPKVMLFDEVTSALDRELVFEVLGVMRQLALEGMTMVAVTHELWFAKNVADRVVLLAEGQVIEEAPPAEFFDSPEGRADEAISSRSASGRGLAQPGRLATRHARYGGIGKISLISKKSSSTGGSN